MAESGVPTPWPADVVPDDARALEPDRRAWLREQRRRRIVHALTHSRSGRSRPIGLYLTLALALVVTTTGLAFSVLPGTAADVVPLASSTVPAGQVGGLLPQVDLATTSGPFPTRDARPAAVVVADPGCACARMVDQLSQTGAAVGVVVWVVAPDRDRATARALVDGLPLGTTRAATDPGNQLRAALRTASGQTSAGPGPTLLLVRDNGLLDAVVSGAAATHLVSGSGLAVRLAGLTRPDSPATRTVP